MTTTIGTIELDGSFTDWLAADSLMNSANTVTGYQVYGALINDATLGENYVIGVDATDSSDAAILAGTIIYLNTDQNNTTGFSPFGVVGAEYQVKFLDDPMTGALQAYLYSADGTTVLNEGLPLASGFSSTGQSVELAIPQTLLTPTGGAAPAAINFDFLLNNTSGLPVSFGDTTPQYVIPDPAAAPAPMAIAGAITLDGTFTDWPAADSVMTSGNTVAGYQVYGAFLSDATLGNTYVIGVDATNSADPAISAGSTIYLNTDQNTTTGGQLSFANVGAEYEVQFVYGPNSELEPFLYSVTSDGVTTQLNNGQPLLFGMSSDGKSVELAIPQSLLTPSGGTAPTSINFAALLNGTSGLPSALASNPEYTITDQAALVPVDHTIKKVGIVYSATTAALYFGGGPAGESAYSDLFMDAQHQAEAAGVSYDLLSESDLTNVAKLSQYSALIFPDFQNVQSSDASAIASALHRVVYEYHVPIITAGDFMTSDQTGAALPATFANMQDLLNVTQSGFNNSATYSVTPDAAALANNNPVLAGYTSGQLIGGASGTFGGDTPGLYTNTGYLTFTGFTSPTAATSLANINILDASGTTTGILPGVVQTTTGGTNTVFATTGLFGDSNLLQQVIQNTVFGTTPSLTIDMTRFKGVVNSRTDMDQSQFPDDVSPTDDNGQPLPGIYDKMIPILASLNQQYDFVGSYYINIGDDANPANNNSTNWAISTPYYEQLLEMGNEIGTHSYTHLIDPPATTVLETTEGDTPAGSTQVKVSALPSYNGATLGMTVTGANIGPNTIITGMSANTDGTYTLTLQYLPGGFGTPNLGVTGDVPAGSTLTFGVPAENTNFLSTGTGTGINQFTYNYEFGQSAQAEGQNLGITVAGAAVPGANDYLPDSQQILQQFQTATLPAGLTGYVSGGWTGVGSGSPNAFGYITPSNSGSVYIAPDITFDFSELQFEGKTPDSALSDWESLFNQLSSNSETPVIVWPWHDYGITDWPTDGPGTTPPGYDETLYQNFIAYAFNADYEFVTSEDLASRIAAQQAATLKEATSGNVITATVTPAASAPDLGAMALNVTNGAAGQVIQNAGNWYAYDSNSVFMPYGGGTFNVTLGATQDDVTHVDSLPMRADLQSVSGDGSNLAFAMTGDGTAGIHIKTPGTNIISVQTSAVGIGAGMPTATLVGDDLELTFNDGPLAFNATSPEGIPVLHNVTVTEGATAVAGATFVFLAPPTIAGTHATPTTLDAAVNPFTGVTIGDLNSGATDTLTITLSNSGTGGILADGNGFGGLVSKGAGVYTLSGTAGAVTNELDALLFTPSKGAPGSNAVTTFTLSDQSTGSATLVTDNATTVTDTDPFAPTIVATHPTTTTNDAAVHPFTGVTIGDLNPGATETLTITLSSPGTVNGASGKLTGTGLAGGANGVYTLSGTAAAVTSELDLLTFTPVKGATGSTTITTFALSDLSSANATPVLDSATVLTDIDAKVAPTIAGTKANQQTTFDAAVSPFAGVTITDVNAGATDTLTITLSNSGKTGTLAGAGLTVGGNGNYTLKGTAAAVTSALDALIFTPANGAAGSVTTTTFTLSDQSSLYPTAVADKTTTVIDTDAAVAPTIVGTHATPTSSDAAVNPFTGVTIGDLNPGATETLTITLSSPGTANGATGTLSGKGLTGGANGVYTLTKGSAAAVTSALDLLSFKPATGLPGSTTTTFTLSDTSSAFTTAATSDNATTVIDTDAAGGALAITSGSYTTSWILGGTAPVGSAVTVLSGTTALKGSPVVATNGSWTFTTGQNNSAIRTFTVSANGITSAPYIEGTAGNDTFSFASEAAVSAAALINGDGGATDALKLTAAATLSDADFAHVQAIEILGLTGASSVTLGPNASAAGITTVTIGNSNTSVTDTNSGALAITATALPAGSILTLAGTSTDTVTGLVGNLSATGDSGRLTVTATGTGAQNIATGSGNISIADSAAGSVTVDAAALGTNTLALTGTAAKTVNNLAGNVVITGAAKVAVNANGSGAQSVTTGNGITTIVANGSGAITVNNANAKGSANTLTLSGTETETVNSLAQNLVASGLSGNLNATTTINGLSITPGTGMNTINAGAMTGTLTLTGSNGATVSAMGGNLNASTNSGTISVTTTGAAQSVTTGSGATTINDTSTANLKVNATALAAASTLTLSGAGTATVTDLKGSLDATGDSGTISVTATGTAQTVTTGSGNMSIADSTSALIVNAGALTVGNTLTLSGSTAKTVSSLQGNLSTSGAGPVNVTAAGSGKQTITTSTGADTITDQTSGNDTIQGGGGADSINVTGHTGADLFTYSATSDSRNTTTGHDLITGFTNANDKLDFSNVNPGTLNIQGALTSSATKVNANSIAWLYLGGSAMVYENNTTGALATTSTNANLMEITLAGLSSGLSNTNFTA